MKGWPLLRAFLVLIVLLLAGLPLRSLTRPKLDPAVTKTPVSKAEKLTIALTFTQPPETFSLKFLGKEILTGGEEASFDVSTTLEAHYPPEGIDLVFEGKWPNFQKAGVIVKVTRADGSQEKQTIWGKRTLFELLTFTGKAQP